MVEGACHGGQGAPLPLPARALLGRGRSDAGGGVAGRSRRGSAVSRLRRRVVVAACGCLCLSAPAWADVFRPAYLELRQRDADRFDVLWKVPAVGDSMRLGIHVRFPADTK